MATYPIHGKTLEEIKKAADDALYLARQPSQNIVKMPREDT